MGHHHLKKGLIHIKTTIITLAKKLLSRKFITALAGVLGGLAMAAGAGAGEIDTVSGAVLAALSALGYIFTEGRLDAERGAKNTGQPQAQEGGSQDA
ncbi:MAG: hypothetical protein J6Q16_01260 [Clostridia bacterium]|nr:hypothetical protein [Clostridia bacterium]